MQVLTIKIPRFRWKIFFPPLLIAFAFSYWFFAVRPYLWISEAKVEAFSLPVRSDLAGRIAQMGPREGEAVRKGQLLFAFDTTAFRTRQKQLQFQMDSLNEQLQKQQLRMDEAMQQYLETPQEEHFAVFEEAQKRSEALSSELAALQTEWETLDFQAQKLVFHAPFDGFVLQRAAEEGFFLSLGDPVYTLCDPTHFWIETQIPEQFLSRISSETAAQVLLPAFPKKEWKGTISWIAPAASGSAIAVRISIEDPAFPVKPGLSAKVRLKVH